MNGVDLDGVELPPASRGMLRPGQLLALGDYRIGVELVHGAGPLPCRPGSWPRFETEAAALAASAPAAPEEADPFGDDWGFQSSFGGTPGDRTRPAAELAPFFAGLGIAGLQPERLSAGELETIGRLTRQALAGLLALLPPAPPPCRQARPDDRTLQEPRDANPLRRATPLEARLWHLFGGADAAAGCLPPERALAEVLEALQARAGEPPAVRAKRHSDAPPHG